MDNTLEIFRANTETKKKIRTNIGVDFLYDGSKFKKVIDFYIDGKYKGTHVRKSKIRADRLLALME